jgi:hypothetical protein
LFGDLEGSEISSAPVAKIIQIFGNYTRIAILEGVQDGIRNQRFSFFGGFLFGVKRELVEKFFIGRTFLVTLYLVIDPTICFSKI